MLVDARIARAVVRELPDALNPAWGARTWSGTFGSLGLRAEATAMDTTLTLSARGVTGTSSVRGHVLGEATSLLDRLRSRGASEAPRGAFAHTVQLHDNGRLGAHHTLLKLDRGSRGSGFGSEFAEHARGRYEAAGIDDAEMFAGMSVGGYAWARQGLELATTETDDVARALDRGRQITNMVDESRRLHVAGRVPRLRTLSEAQYETVAHRLVRGDTLPSQAITSVEELASIPEVGRSVLLGRMFKGSAEMERTGSWWTRNGSDAAAHAASGVSYRSSPALVAEQSQLAARRIAGQMPAAVDPFRATATFARHLAGLGVASVDDARDGARAILRLGLEDAAPTVRTTIPMRTAGGGRVELGVTWDGARLVATERVPVRDWRNVELRRALDAAWRELGVERVQSTRSGIRRSIAPAVES